MKLVKQPIGSSQCGPACIATICGISLGESLAIFRSKGATRTKQLVQVLRQMGITCGDKLTRGFPKECSAILKFKHPSGKSHWVVWYKNKYYDPVAGVFRKVPKWLKKSRVTSHLRVTDKRKCIAG